MVKTNEIRCVGPRDPNPFPEFKVINTTSQSTNDWQRELSPFYLGPCESFDRYMAQRFENLWQYSKVYRCHLDHGWPSEEWFEWRGKGFASDRAHRYPMGKGAIPEYSYWDYERLGYVEARQRIYIPEYVRLVSRTEAYRRLQIMAEDRPVALFDFDAYNYVDLGISFDRVIHNPRRKMGHGMVLCALLRGEIKEAS